MVPSASPLTEVLLFARAPRSGQVKTRLSADIGADRALQIYRTVGSRVVRQIAPVSSITAWYDPPDAEEEMRAWLGELSYRPQPEGDLGARLAHAFAEHFVAKPLEPALAIGCDAPGVDAAIIKQARGALRSKDIVLGPASDGGYYLIGLAQHRRELFEGIPWGTDRVFECTIGICDAIGSEPAILPELQDVDRAADLTALDR